MLIALIQSDLVWGNPEANRRKIDELIAKTPHADLYLLPEMFSTGFMTTPGGVAEPAQGPTLAWMKNRSAFLGAAIAGSVSVIEDGKYYNRMYFVRPDGTFDYYDKRHLFRAEGQCYTPGTRRVVAEWKGLRFLLATCYDLRFPVWLRNRKDYDMMLIGASWPTARRAAWDALLKARAIENLCYVAAVDRTGNDPNASYNGGSVILDPFGECVCSCPDGEECGMTGSVDPDLIESFRKRSPILEDADDFEVKI